MLTVSEHVGQSVDEAADAIDQTKPVAEEGEDVAFAVFDIETAPLDDETLRRLCSPCDLPAHPGEFDPASVRCGNLGGPTSEKGKAKIAEKRAEHAKALVEYGAVVEQAKADHFAKFKNKAALDATTGRVVAIGIMPCPIMGGGPGIISCDARDSANSLCDEVSGLKLFWQWVGQNIDMQRPMVGLNTHGFDLPFLVRRSWMLGVPVPHGIRQGRYWNSLFIDLANVWTFGAYKEYIGLNDLAHAFGLEGKVEEVDGVAVSGATFYELWRTNRKVAEAYLMADLRIPSELAVRMGVV